MNFSRRTVALAVFFGTTIPTFACTEGEAHEYTMKNQIELSLRVDLSCPSVRDIENERGLVWGTVSADPDMQGVEVWYEPRTICWYRIVEPDADSIPCLNRPISGNEFLLNRNYYLSQANRSEYLHSESSYGYDSAYDVDRIWNYFASCDQDGPLYGHILTKQVTDPRAAASVVPEECPAEVTPVRAWAESSDAGKHVSTFVGRDFYPARIMCMYTATTTSRFQGGGGGCAPKGVFSP